MLFERKMFVVLIFNENIIAPLLKTSIFILYSVLTLNILLFLEVCHIKEVKLINLFKNCHNYSLFPPMRSHFCVLKATIFNSF